MTSLQVLSPLNSFSSIASCQSVKSSVQQSALTHVEQECETPNAWWYVCVPAPSPPPPPLEPPATH